MSEPVTVPEAVWHGRLATALDPRAQRLNDSLAVDRRLWPEELLLSRAYAETLAECGVLDTPSFEALRRACHALGEDLAAGRVTLEGEDVHSAVENELVSRCGDAARRLHTGRSRNDQVGTLTRLHVMRQCDETVESLRALARALLAQARGAADVAVAAHTHLQPAQPVRLAHLWLAHAHAFERDETRFEAAREAADRMPLGAGAVAGTPLRYDRLALASRLGFSRLAENSVDAVGDRDFALEYLNAASLLGVHLSRLAEDLVLWCSPAFGWFRAPDGFATGSSLLPQKRNPDVFELTRGKSARLIANAQRLAIVMKGLPSAYQKDLQEDKEALFDTEDTLAQVLAALPPAIEALTPIGERMRASLTPDLLAVELADALVERGLPFRDAHAAVGRLWALAESRAVSPAALSLAERVEISEHFTDERLAALTVEASLARRSHAPGAGSESVAEQIERQEQRLGMSRADRARAPEARVAPSVASPIEWTSAPEPSQANATVLRRATLEDVPGIARIMAEYVAEGVLLPRPVGELFQCIREFHVAERDGQIVACAALRLLWDDLGEVRSLAVRPDHHGQGLGAKLVAAVIADARTLAVPRVIALTREVAFFERCGFGVMSRDRLPRKVWSDCVRCPKRHACDEVAVVLDLVPGASAAADAAAGSWLLPIPQLARPDAARASDGPSLPTLTPLIS
jgi:argininosuccinate lyase/amino-acid N-acetyltransferase